MFFLCFPPVAQVYGQRLFFHPLQSRPASSLQQETLVFQPDQILLRRRCCQGAKLYTLATNPSLQLWADSTPDVLKAVHLAVGRAVNCSHAGDICLEYSRALVPSLSCSGLGCVVFVFCCCGAAVDERFAWIEAHVRTRALSSGLPPLIN